MIPFYISYYTFSDVMEILFCSTMVLVDSTAATSSPVVIVVGDGKRISAGIFLSHKVGTEQDTRRRVLLYYLYVSSASLIRKSSYSRCVTNSICCLYYSCSHGEIERKQNKIRRYDLFCSRFSVFTGGSLGVYLITSHQ